MAAGSDPGNVQDMRQSLTRLSQEEAAQQSSFWSFDL